jgi:amino acid permease
MQYINPTQGDYSSINQHEVTVRVSNVSYLNDDMSFNLLEGEDDFVQGKSMIFASKSVLNKESKSSNCATFVNLCKCFLGAASFSLPWAYQQAGLVGAFVGTLIFFAISNFSLKALARSARMATTYSNQTPSYGDIGQAAFGPIGKFLAWFGVLAMTAGVCGTYLVFVADALQIFTGLSTISSILLTLPLLIPLSWLRSYKWLAPVSGVGLIALLCSLVVVVIYGGLNPVQDFEAFVEKPDIVLLDTFPLFVGNIAFLFLIHSVAVPIQRNMETPEDYDRMVDYSMVAVSLVNMLFAYACTVVFGDEVQGNILNNLPEGTLRSVAVGAVAIDLFATVPAFLFPVSDAAERVLFNEALFGTFATEAKRNLFRAFLVCGIAGTSVAIPIFELLAGFSGGFGNMVVGIILPPLLFAKLRAKNEPLPAWQECGCFMLSLLGVGLMVLSTFFTIQGLLKFSNEVPEDVVAIADAADWN